MVDFFSIFSDRLDSAPLPQFLPSIGNGWDEAIMEEAEIQNRSHQLRKGFTDGMPSAALASNPVVAKIVMPANG